MSDEHRPRPPRPGGPSRQGGLRPGAPRPTYSAGGAKAWASRRAISQQVAGMVGPEHEVIAGRRPV
ncbi:MAG: hypothetical protein ACKOFY_01140, partial [Candidatus Limnocylindrus sp.]